MARPGIPSSHLPILVVCALALSRRHLAARPDLGDTIVWCGKDLVISSISGVGGSVTAGKRHQLNGVSDCRWGF